MKPPSNRRKITIISLFLFIVTVGVFWPVSQHEFINFDDPDYVTENEKVKAGLTWDGIIWSFTTGHASNWHPITWLTHMTDVSLFGLNPTGHHLMNLGFHCVNAILLLIFLHQITGTVWRSAMVASLFALHPLHVESVAWVAERKDVLSTFFGLLTIMVYVSYAQDRCKNTSETSQNQAKFAYKVLWYVAALLLFALGLMSKPMLVTWPFVMLLLDWWPLNRFAAATSKWPILVLEKLPFILLTAASCVITFAVQQRGGAVTSADNLPLYDRFENSVASYVKYIGKTLWPLDLAIFYPHPELRYPISAQWPAEIILLSGIALVAVSIAVLCRRTRQPYLLCGWFWFIGTLVPVIGVVQVGAQAMADRYSYIPLIGVFICSSWLGNDLLSSWTRRVWIRPAIAVLTILVCSILSYRQVLTWKNDFSVFGHALSVTEQNAPAHSTLGKAWGKVGDYEKALQHLQAAKEADPNYANVYYDLGLTMMYLGRYHEAVEYYQAELSRKPDHLMAQNNIAVAYSSIGNNEKAVESYRRLLTFKPDYAQAHHGLGLVLAEMGQLAEAESHLRQSLTLSPNFETAHVDLARVLIAAGKHDAAAEALSSLNRIETRPELLTLRANALFDAGKTNEAAVLFAEIVRIFPQFVSQLTVEAHRLITDGNSNAALNVFSTVSRLRAESLEIQTQIGLLLAQAGLVENAIPYFRNVCELQPTGTNFLHLAMAYAAVSRAAEAIENYSRALEITPDFPEALNNLAWILATHPDLTFRDGQRAIKLALRANELTGGREPLFLGTLAAAYAEAGLFTEAIRIGEEARQIAEQREMTELANKNADLINKYRTGKPHRQAMH